MMLEICVPVFSANKTAAFIRPLLLVGHQYVRSCYFAASVVCGDMMIEHDEASL